MSELEIRGQGAYNNSMIRSDLEIKEKGNNVMKKLFCLMLALAMLLLSATCLADADTEETVLRVGTNPEFPAV